jgi:hypothetical protein
MIFITLYRELHNTGSLSTYKIYFFCPTVRLKKENNYTSLILEYNGQGMPLTTHTYLGLMLKKE